MFESRLTAAMAFVTLVAAFAVALASDDPTPALTLAGALVLAIIAAETADTRQQRQIEAERERHLATLTHARELADLADLRGLLDEAAAVLHRADKAAFTLADAYATDGAEVDGERQTKLATEVYALDDLEPRLEVRLGRSAPAARAFAESTSAAINVVQAVRRGEEATVAKSAAAALADAKDRFTSAIVELAGTRVEPRPNGTDEGTTTPETT